MITNLIEDITLLTDVSEPVLKKFIPVCNYSIGHALHEAQCIQEDYVEIDVGIGELHIKVDNNTLQYRFIPSKDLEKILVQTVCTGKSPMILKLDNNLQDKIEQAYKELL